MLFKKKTNEFYTHIEYIKITYRIYPTSGFSEKEDYVHLKKSGFEHMYVQGMCALWIDTIM